MPEKFVTLDTSIQAKEEKKYSNAQEMVRIMKEEMKIPEEKIPEVLKEIENLLQEKPAN